MIPQITQVDEVDEALKEKQEKLVSELKTKKLAIRKGKESKLPARKNET